MLAPPVQCPQRSARLGLNHNDFELNLSYTSDCGFQSMTVKTLLRVCSQIYFLVCMFVVIKLGHVYTVCKTIYIGFKGWIWILQTSFPLVVLSFYQQILLYSSGLSSILICKDSGLEVHYAKSPHNKKNVCFITLTWLYCDHQAKMR